MSGNRQTSNKKASPSGISDNDRADIDSALCSYLNVIAEQRALAELPRECYLIDRIHELRRKILTGSTA